jgi:hypothetical protein
MSSPRKRGSKFRLANLDPRFRGDDGDSYCGDDGDSYCGDDGDSYCGDDGFRYSERSAVAGSTREARRAGM